MVKSKKEMNLEDIKISEQLPTVNLTEGTYEETTYDFFDAQEISDAFERDSRRYSKTFEVGAGGTRL